jgi:hypothetical protein
LDIPFGEAVLRFKVGDHFIANESLKVLQIYLRPGDIIELKSFYETDHSDWGINFEFVKLVDWPDGIPPNKISKAICSFYIDPVVSQPSRPKICVCNIWAGCSCGVFEEEMRAKHG